MTNEKLKMVAAINGGADIKTLPLRVVDYARVSTTSFAQMQSLENQKETYRNYIENVPAWQYAGTYTDEGITGTKIYYRGGFQEMLDDAQAGKFDLIIVKNISRFARNLKECLNIKDQLKSCGVMVYFVENNLNTFRTGDETMLQFMALGAEMEAKSARERTRIVFEQGIQQGKVYGNSKILGYKKVNCSLAIDEQEAEIVRLIFELYVHERMGLRRIAKVLVERGMLRKDGTQISIRSLKSILENPKYKGYYCGGKTEKYDIGVRYVRRDRPQEEWVMYPDPTIPAIVSEELWDAAAQIRAEKNAKYRSEVSAPCNQGIYKYSSLIESEFVPGLYYTRTLYRYKGLNREAWQCRNYKDPANPGNVGPTLYTDELDAILFDILDELLDGYDCLIDDLVARYRAAATETSGETSVEHLQLELQKIGDKQDRLLELYEDGLLDKTALAQRNQAHEARKKALNAEIREIKEHDKTIKQLTCSLEELRNSIAEAVKTSSLDAATIRSLIDKIVVRSDSTKTKINIDIILRATGLAQTFSIMRNRQNKRSEDNDSLSCNLCNKHISTLR